MSAVEKVVALFKKVISDGNELISARENVKSVTDKDISNKKK